MASFVPVASQRNNMFSKNIKPKADINPKITPSDISLNLLLAISNPIITPMAFTSSSSKRVRYLKLLFENKKLVFSHKKNTSKKIFINKPKKADQKNTDIKVGRNSEFFLLELLSL